MQKKLIKFLRSMTFGMILLGLILLPQTLNQFLFHIIGTPDLTQNVPEGTQLHTAAQECHRLPGGQILPGHKVQLPGGYFR